MESAGRVPLVRPAGNSVMPDARRLATARAFALALDREDDDVAVPQASATCVYESAGVKPHASPGP